ncbi:Hypothetical predicted protein [Mytilus galloprovincialis]|uniref:Uncharacterized protein n=1 Tax=Mytilus galloprovincialis TaxID=29158 RepID=A0A8B6F6L5_MYTGA|nr:Hypothetical predicted protein [Mytilus galloprovincialis]
MSMLPNNPEFVTCKIRDSCTSLECCLITGKLGRSFKLFIEIEPCLFQLRLGIEEMTFNMLLFDFEWGQPVEAWLFGLVRMKVSPNYNVFCLNDTCDSEERFSVPVLENVTLPKQKCQWRESYRVKDFSLGQWSKQKNMEQSSVLPEYYISELLEQLGLTNYLMEKQCRGNNEINGWKSGVVLPDLSRYPISCQLLNNCTDLICCIDVPLINRTFKVSFGVHQDDQLYSIGIEKLNFRIPFHHFTFGKYKIYNLRNAMKVRMTLYIDICLEGTPNCGISYLILNHTDLPKAVCNWKQQYMMSESRTQDLKQKLVMIKDGSLADYQVYKLLEESNIGYHLSKDECKIPQTMYKWKNACPHFLQLGVLDGPIFCWINTGCTSIICCVHDDVTQRNYQMNLHVSSCDRNLELKIEQYGFNQSLLDFKYGDEYAVHLGGIFRISVVIDYLVKTGSFIVNMNISICWSYNEECDYNVKILDDLELPKSNCDMARNYQTKGFSLMKWFSKTGYQNTKALTGQVLTDLNEVLGIMKYYQQDECGRRMLSFNSSNMDGLKNECRSNRHVFSPLPSNITCNIQDHCTAVDCCIHVELLNRSFHVYMDIDSCYYRLTVGIERMNYTMNLFDYKWGFSLSQWLAQKQINDKDVLPKSTTLHLMEDLNISPYINGSLCRRKVATFEQSNDGWKNECKKTVSIPSLKDTESSCILGASCSDIKCCVDDGLLDKSFMYFLKIDPCKSTLTIGIENRWLTQSSIEFEFGERKEFYIKGTLGMEYIVDELQSSNEYLVSVNISVCFEPNKSQCYIQTQIVKDLLITKPQCNWNMHFKTPGFSLKSWMQTNQFSLRYKLPVYANYLLMETLGVSKYLLKKSCHQQKTLEQRTVNGWIQDCPLTIEKPKLGNGVTCKLMRSCTGVECCVDVELIDRSILFKLDLDPCNHNLVLRIESLVYNISLLNFDWGLPFKHPCRLAYLSMLLITISNNINLNPGPDTSVFPCGSCNEPVTWDEKGIMCDTFSQWYHVSCQSMSSQTYNILADDSCIAWDCLIYDCPNYRSVCFELVLTTSNSFSILSDTSLQSPIPSDCIKPMHASIPERKKRNNLHAKAKPIPIKMLTVNFQSLKSKQGLVKTLVESTKPDHVLCIETWIDPSITDNQIFQPNYNIYRNDRNLQGGGVLIAINSDHLSTPVPELQTNC